MQYSKAFHTPSCFSSLFSHTSVQHICVAASQFSVHLFCIVSEFFSRSIVSTGLNWSVSCCFLAPSLFCSAEGGWGVTVCPWLLCQIQMKLSTYTDFSDLERALRLEAKHLWPCSFNLVDKCCTTWVDEMNLSMTSCILLDLYHHLLTHCAKATRVSALSYWPVKPCSAVTRAYVTGLIYKVKLTNGALNAALHLHSSPLLASLVFRWLTFSSIHCTLISSPKHTAVVNSIK